MAKKTDLLLNFERKQKLERLVIVRVGSLKAADELTGGCCRLVKGIHFIFVDGEKREAPPLLPSPFFLRAPIRALDE